jgi:hypothetical protein
MSKGKNSHLRVWKEFRDSIVKLDKNQKIKSINNFWMLHPFMTRTIDPDDPSSWMNPWDMVYYDNICEYSRAIIMHQTALLMIGDIQESYLIYAIDEDKHQDFMLAVVDDMVMNHSMDVGSFQLISPNLRIQNKFISNKKGAYSLI